jgi:hypothetical protein
MSSLEEEALAMLAVLEAVPAGRGALPLEVIGVPSTFEVLKVLKAGGGRGAGAAWGWRWWRVPLEALVVLVSFYTR